MHFLMSHLTFYPMFDQKSPNEVGFQSLAGYVNGIPAKNCLNLKVICYLTVLLFQNPHEDSFFLF